MDSGANSRGHGPVNLVVRESNLLPKCTCIVINQDMYYTDSKGNSLFANIFTVKISIKLSYVNILINFCYNKTFFLNNKPNFSYRLDSLEFAF